MSSVDLSLLSAPDVVEPLDYEATLAALKADLVARYPACADVIDIESEPLTYLLEAFAYSKVNDRARVNDAARSVMLAYATGADLDQIGANYETVRLPGEADNAFRTRIQQSYHRLAAAGPANAYRQHALGVSADIVDVDVYSESPGQVSVVVLARQLAIIEAISTEQIAIGRALFGAGPDDSSAWIVAASDSPLLRAVLATLNAEDVRPLTDAVIVRAPEVTTFAVAGALQVLSGPDPDLIRTRRLAAAQAYLASVSHIRYDVTRAGLIAALVEPGVKNVRLDSPTLDIVRARGQLAVCTGITLSAEVVDA